MDFFNHVLGDGLVEVVATIAGRVVNGGAISGEEVGPGAFGRPRRWGLGGSVIVLGRLAGSDCIPGSHEDCWWWSELVGEAKGGSGPGSGMWWGFWRGRWRWGECMGLDDP